MKKEPINIESVYSLYREYYDAYAQERARLAKCERIYRGDHWYDVPQTEASEPRPVTPVIQSTIENVRADLNDSMPDAIITADRQDYEELAEAMTHIVRENHQRCHYDDEYALLTHDLLVGGYAVQEIGFDPEANAGTGGAYIRHVDNASVMFDPLSLDIQEGRAIFKFTHRTRDWFRQHYPNKADSITEDGFLMDTTEDGLLTPRYDRCILLIECWQRVYDPRTDSHSVHMIRVAGGQLLEDSRDAAPDGYYAHGMYPFVITTLFPRKGSCLGYGFVDMFETSQRYSDKLDQIVMKNAMLASHNKLLITGASGFDADDLRDWSKEVHRGDNLNGVTWFATAPLPAYLIEYISAMRDAIKEESGSNEWSRGMTNYGVTAGTAISALQDKSSKRSRMAARGIHSAFRAAVEQELEIERQFTLGLRCMRDRLLHADAEGAAQIEASARSVMALSSMPVALRVTVKVQKENGFSAISHNDTVFRLVETGMVTPQVGLELLMFDGKEQAKSMMATQAS